MRNFKDGIVLRIYRNGEPVGFWEGSKSIIQEGDLLLYVEPNKKKLEFKNRLTSDKIDCFYLHILIMDNEIFDVITKELDRQTYNIELIASENYVSDSVLRAQGSILTNKYAEGYPDKRYYGGCEFVDIVEN